MFYTKVARVMAAIAFFFGVSAALLGIGLAMAAGFELAAEGVEAATVTSSKLSGQLIDYGIYSTLVGVVLGVLAEISRSLSKNETNNK